MDPSVRDRLVAEVKTKARLVITTWITQGLIAADADGVQGDPGFSASFDGTGTRLYKQKFFIKSNRFIIHDFIPAWTTYFGRPVMYQAFHESDTEFELDVLFVLDRA